MTDDQRQQDFAQRLSRITQERGQGVETSSKQPTRDIADFDYNTPHKRHPIRNGIIWMIILAAAGTGGYYGWQAIPQDLKDMLVGMIAPDDSLAAGGLPPEAIPETDTMSDQGPVLSSPSVLAGSGVLTLLDIVDNVSLPTGNTEIGDIIPIIRKAQCNLRPLLPSEKIMGVRIENALLPAPLYAFSNRQLADQLLFHVESVTQDGAPPTTEMGLTGEKAVLDVFITDTSAPLYLVLQNIGQGIIWNLHPAPEVEIAHVALIGSDFSGAANLPVDTTIEGMLVSDFVPPHQYGADDTPRDCMIRPWRNPEPDWIASRKSEAGSLVSQNEMYSYSKGYAAYNRWFTTTLGVDAATNTVTARDAAHVLLGPQPAEPFAYSPLAGRDVHLMEADHLFVGDAASRNAAAARLHQDLLAAAIGGDISALDPPAVEGANP
ncbi:hypothetical protein [Yoonia sp.]|uniref:hypothetical protein n=1 Tax=Yoonia sp. TaxID=2212373 RepID=UPI003974AE1C